MLTTGQKISLEELEQQVFETWIKFFQHEIDADERVKKLEELEARGRASGLVKAIEGEEGKIPLMVKIREKAQKEAKKPDWKKLGVAA